MILTSTPSLYPVTWSPTTPLRKGRHSSAFVFDPHAPYSGFCPHCSFWLGPSLPGIFRAPPSAPSVLLKCLLLYWPHLFKRPLPSDRNSSTHPLLYLAPLHLSPLSKLLIDFLLTLLTSCLPLLKCQFYEGFSAVLFTALSSASITELHT